jgi:hypothetical protein
MVVPARSVRLGDFQLDGESGELSRNGRKVRLPDQLSRVNRAPSVTAGAIAPIVVLPFTNLSPDAENQPPRRMDEVSAGSAFSIIGIRS